MRFRMHPDTCACRKLLMCSWSYCLRLDFREFVAHKLKDLDQCVRIYFYEIKMVWNHIGGLVFWEAGWRSEQDLRDCCVHTVFVGTGEVEDEWLDWFSRPCDQTCGNGGRSGRGHCRGERMTEENRQQIFSFWKKGRSAGMENGQEILTLVDGGMLLMRRRGRKRKSQQEDVTLKVRGV